ncbi:F0F1 ATP synthase subunit delta [Pseudoalteromonas sp. NBT06-2]|uniref:F0F1 ATP synthase subunit delta n=1 Tax=Pseudoalteromonas sp. NBT06-2 TaxID=2025950 RepID=UPI000BA5E7F9|nr:F0F1 ATP synthase subunit delta [Pseudoalteromonas sp. NBT06-2]PAJ75920.1 F0F1 ATP synthase subunit delta [Pseudoalteromonas sp. NBT06-2]
MSELTTIARPYAKAAFEFAVDKNAVADWNNMLEFAAQVANNQQVLSYVSSKASEEQAEIFISVCAEQINEYGQNLIKVLAENGRLVALPAVAELFTAFKAEYDKEIDVDIVSATELAASQQDALVSALEKRFSRKIKLNCSVDETLVGGLIVKAGDNVIDGSIRGKLNRLATTLQS